MGGIGGDLAGPLAAGIPSVSRKAGLDRAAWTPRELRHSFVSLLSDSGMSIEHIADLCGHAGTTVTERVYRHQLRPVLLGGAVTMDRVFTHDQGDEDQDDDAAEGWSLS